MSDIFIILWLICAIFNSFYFLWIELKPKARRYVNSKQAFKYNFTVIMICALLGPILTLILFKNFLEYNLTKI